jgi:hypothetical protein
MALGESDSLRVIAHREVDLVTVVSQSLDHWNEESDVRRVGKVDPDPHWPGPLCT